VVSAGHSQPHGHGGAACERKWRSTFAKAGRSKDRNSGSADYERRWLTSFFRHFKEAASANGTGLARTYYVLNTVHPFDLSGFDTLTGLVNPDPYIEGGNDSLLQEVEDDSVFDFDAEDRTGVSRFLQTCFVKASPNLRPVSLTQDQF